MDKEHWMTWSFTPTVGIFFLSGLISLLAALQTSRKREIPGALAFVLWVSAVAEWNFASAIETGMVEVASKIIWAKIEYIGSLSAPALFLIFALEFSQRTRWLTRRNLFFLSLLLILSLIFVGTNEYHHLIWSGFSASPAGNNLLVYHHGVGFYFIATYEYFFILLGIVSLIFTYR
jgi:hypothetical protein